MANNKGDAMRVAVADFMGLPGDYQYNLYPSTNAPWNGAVNGTGIPYRQQKKSSFGRKIAGWVSRDNKAVPVYEFKNGNIGFKNGRAPKSRIFKSRKDASRA